MDKIWESIKNIAEDNNGFLKTGQIEEMGISRPVLRKYVDEGKLEQVRKGLYILSEGLADEYALLQAQSAKAVFSYGTALFLWELSDRAPHFWDITLPHGTNISRLKRDNPNLHCHYVQPHIYEMGITQTYSPQGGAVKLYDRAVYL